MKSRIRAGISIAIVTLFIIISFVPVINSSDANIHQRQRAHIMTSTTAISPTAITIIYMDTGMPNNTMTNKTADGYNTSAFPANTFLSYVNFTITVSVEKYYRFSIWAGKLWIYATTSRLLMKLDNELLGNEFWISTVSGSNTTFNDFDHLVAYGVVRVPTGSYTLQMVNLVNDSSISDDYIGIVVEPQSLTVHPKLFSFAVVSDTHYTLNSSPLFSCYGNWLMLNYASELSQRYVTQINNMAELPSFVVMTGDLINGASPLGDGRNGYLLQKGDFDNLTMPYYPVLGNHDHNYASNAGNITEAYSSLIPEWSAPKTNYDEFNYYRDFAEVRLIFMDSGHMNGSYDNQSDAISATQQSWLNSTLRVNKPVFVFLHCPLIAGLSWDYHIQSDAIRTSLEAYDNVVAVFNGHGHTEWIQALGGILYVETASALAYPLTYTVVDYYGGNLLDINRYQVTDSLPILALSCGQVTNTTFSLGFTDDILISQWGNIRHHIPTIPSPQISGLIDVIFMFFAVGIVVGVIAEGTNSLRKEKMPTTEKMIKSLINMMVYIIIGMASLGIMYSMV